MAVDGIATMSGINGPTGTGGGNPADASSDFARELTAAENDAIKNVVGPFLLFNHIHFDPMREELSELASD